MNRWTLSVRSLRYYWRTHLSVLAGLAVGSGVLVGALLVGDSVDYTLHRIAGLRVGSADHVWVGNDRFFRAEVADEDGTPVVMLQGSVALPAGTRRANDVQVLGVTDGFFALAPDARPPAGWDSEDGAWLNMVLAHRLGVQAGDTVVLRLAKPSALPTDAPLSSDEDRLVALRLPVRGLVDDGAYGRFSLRANQVQAPSIFLPLAQLQAAIDLPGRANLIVSPRVCGLYSSIRMRWTLADSELSLVPVPGQELVELRTDRVFLEPGVTEPVLESVTPAFPVLSYLVNRISAGDRSIPYSTVAAVPFEGDSPWTGLVETPPAADEVVLNQWAADDLDAKLGDSVTLAYYRMGDLRTLIETTAVFRVAAVVPIEGVAADPTLMPDYPGFAGAEDCRDWDPGFAVDLDQIRDRDEAYWDEHRGTPKAFIPLAAGRQLWGNRFGDLTGIRFPARPELEHALTVRIEPADLGHSAFSLYDQAERAAHDAMSFSGLFFGFSMFLIGAALLLTGMLFVFGVDQRVREMGTLLAVGYSPGQVLRVLAREGLLLASLGAVAGTGLGLIYTRLLLRGLGTVWQSAVGDTDLWFSARPGSLVLGFALSVGLGLGVMAWSVRRRVKRPPTELLKGDLRVSSGRGGKHGWWARGLAWGGGLGALATTATTLVAGGSNPAEGFFVAGMLALISLLAGCRIWLSSAARRAADGERFGRAAWTVRNLTLRPGRSLATITLLACGMFMVAASGVHRQSAQRDADRPSSGTGGFRFVGQASQPVTRDLNRPAEQEYYGLDTDLLTDVSVVPLRVRPGDDASCLNLNRAQQPTLAGVPSQLLAGRFTAASVARPWRDTEDPWSLLRLPLEDGAIPAIADLNSILWAMGKKVGDTLVYTDEQGDELRIRLVAGLANSMVQGLVLIDEGRFSEAFPSASGFRQLWVDAPGESAEAVADELSFALQDYGLDLERAVDRLDAFNDVQNTYLAIFQVLGGMGLLLGSLGLGVVVLRNVLERRGELALLRGVGFSRAGVRRLVVGEHVRLLAAGLGVGVLSASLAVVPTLLTPGASFPTRYIGLLILAVAVNGGLWVVAAAALALRGDLLPALREE